MPSSPLASQRVLEFSPPVTGLFRRQRGQMGQREAEFDEAVESVQAVGAVKAAENVEPARGIEAVESFELESIEPVELIEAVEIIEFPSRPLHLPGATGSTFRSVRLALPLILISVLAVGCNRRPPPPPAVAELGENDVVRLPELEAELERVRKESGANATIDAAEQGALRRAVLEQLIDRRLLLAEAIQRGLSVSDHELEDAVRRRLAAREYDEGPDRAAPPSEPGTTPAIDREPRAGLRGQVIGRSDRERIRNQLLIDKLLLAEVVSRVALGPDDAFNWYEENPEEFEIDEQVRCQQILVPTRDVAVALRRELSRGGDFAELAREHSTTPDSRNGGDLGFFSRGIMPEVIEETCFGLRHNQLSDVIESPYGGFHIFQRTDFHEASTLPFEEVKEAIEMKLTRHAIARAQENFIERLRANTGVRIREDVLEGRSIPSR